MKGRCISACFTPRFPPRRCHLGAPRHPGARRGSGPRPRRPRSRRLQGDIDGGKTMGSMGVQWIWENHTKTGKCHSKTIGQPIGKWWFHGGELNLRWENHGKTLGKRWFYGELMGFLMELPFGKHWHRYGRIHHFWWENIHYFDWAMFNSYVQIFMGFNVGFKWKIIISVNVI